MSHLFRPFHYNRATVLSFVLFVAVFTSWLYFTPPGLLGKADAVGYAICHQIEERTFHMGERPLPLCARCSGMYLGAFTGILIQLVTGKKGGLPSKKILAVLAILVLAFAVDGVNSYLHLLPNFKGLYEPNNILRLVTGTGVGIGMGLVLIPIIHQSYWIIWDPDPAVSRWRDLLGIMAAALSLGSLLLTGNPLLLYPLAIFSTLTVFFILGMIYSVVWIMIFKKENTFNTWKEAAPYIISGFIVAVLQIFIIDVARLAFTGSWSGFNFF